MPFSSTGAVLVASTRRSIPRDIQPKIIAAITVGHLIETDFYVPAGTHSICQLAHMLISVQLLA